MASHSNATHTIGEDDHVAFTQAGRVIIGRVDRRTESTKLVVVDDSNGREVLVHETQVCEVHAREVGGMVLESSCVRHRVILFVKA